MPAKDTGTEQLIKSAARKLFFKEGKLHATTQDIADAAGINRAAVHYYFRTRDRLVAEVFRESMLSLSTILGAVMTSEQPFKEKILQMIDVYMEEMIAYPYQETFLITEINTTGIDLVQSIDGEPVAVFLKEVEREVHNGTIKKMDARHFLMNLFSLLSYPIIMAPVYRQLFNMAANDFEQLMAARKQLICRIIFEDKNGSGI